MKNVQHESAKIYQFPVGGRAGLQHRVIGSKAPVYAERIADIAFGGSWYHDEAVREAAEQSRKN